MRRIASCLLALAMLGVGAACGGDSGPPLSADEFVRQANGICKASVDKLTAENADIVRNPTTSAEKFVKFYREKAIPSAKQRLSDIGDLRPPDKQKDKVKKMLSAGRKTIDAADKALKKNGVAGLNEVSTKDFDKAAKDLKLDECTLEK